MDSPSQPSATGPITTGRSRRSPLLGVLSLVILAVALILISVLAYGWISISSGTPAFGVWEVRTLMVGPGLAGVIVGLAGAVMAVIAIAAGRGRKFAVIALVLVPLSWVIAVAGLVLAYVAS